MTYTPTDEQIETVARILATPANPDIIEFDAFWDLVLTQTIRDRHRHTARAVLMRVGPSIAAQGWDEGAEEAWAASGEGWNYEYGPHEHPLTNPYREQEAR